MDQLYFVINKIATGHTDPVLALAFKQILTAAMRFECSTTLDFWPYLDTEIDRIHGILTVEGFRCSIGKHWKIGDTSEMTGRHLFLYW
jgi:hypothetical protein